MVLEAFSKNKMAFLLSFLAFITLSSKNFIIYNEETLVAVTFLVFVFLGFHYLGTPVQQMLDEKAHGIQEELQSFINIKQEQFLQQIQNAQKKELIPDMLKLIDQESNRFLKQSTQKQSSIVQNHLHQRTQLLLDVLAQSQRAQATLNRQLAASRFRVQVLKKYMG